MSIQAVLSIVLSLFFFTITRAQKTIAAYSTLQKEHNCMQYFDNTAQGYAPINVFLMAKFSELIYPERLDYNIRYNQNAQSKVDSIPSTQWISDNLRIDDDNFQSFFEGRFRHYFNSEKGKVNFKYLHKTHIEPSRFLGIKTKAALDPELILISTPTQIFIIFRGTDRAGKYEWAEWFGTDFKIAMTKAGGALVGTNIHTGFWRSFDLIRDDLMAQLSLFDAKNKKVFLTGHSLGGAMAIIAGAYLKASSFDVQNIYAYAAPITLGGFKFKK
jgi:triacylglycerol lipase